MVKIRIMIEVCGVTEMATILAAAASAGVAIVIWITQGKARDVQLKQLAHQVSLAEHQKDLDSARLVIEIDKQFRTDEFRDVLRHVQDDKWSREEYSNEENRLHLDRFINYVSAICSFHDDGALTEVHMRRHYDGTLIELDKNPWVSEYMDGRKEWWLIHARLKEIKARQKNE